MRNAFADKRALITATLISSCHWETLVPFSLRKKRPENTFLTPIVGCRNFVQKNNYAIQNNNKLAI